MKKICYLYFVFAVFSSFLVKAAEPAQTTPRLAPDLLEQTSLEKRSTTAEVLYSISQTKLLADGHWQRTSYYSIRINDLASARDYGRIVIPYNHYYSDMELDFANSLSPEGKLNALAKDALQRRVTGGGQDFYSDSSELVFSLPEVHAGSVIEFQYTQKSRNLAFPELYNERSTPFWFQEKVAKDSWRADFVHHYQFSFTTLADNTIYTKAYLNHPLQSTDSQDGPWLTRSWKMNHVAEIVVERRMPRGHKIRPELMLSTQKDWSVVDQWTWNKVADKLPATLKVKGAVAQLGLSPHASYQQKVEAVYQHLQDKVRYVFAHLGRGGYDPHFPDDVIQAGYGDCKDQTVLAVAMLRELGIDSYPALVETPRNGNSDTELVRLIFDHMIVYIPPQNGQQELWLDTTGDRGLFPGMSNFMVGQNALIVNGRGGRLLDIAQTSFNDNSAVLNIVYQLDESGASQAQVDIELSGMFEQHIRSWYKHSSEQSAATQQFFKGLYSQGLEYQLVGEVLNSEALFTPVRLSAKFNFDKQDESNPIHGANLNQLLGMFADFNNLPIPEERVNRYIDKYPYTLKLNAKFIGGADKVASLVQSSPSMDNDFFTVAQQGKQQQDDFVVSIEFAHHKLDLTVPAYQDYYAKVQQMSRLDAWLVSLRTDPNKVQTLAKQQASAQFGNHSVEFYLVEARQLLQQGKFSDAIVPAKKAVELDNKNGEAWYVLATAQGFATQIEASKRSFAKAAELGYQP
ncbi:hypothetical protein DS2_17342 [Catenovulum agarivorans DS-2]|uniref:Uncharacterized protein n=1 Tax=Catenovulum agarivorans DS-2 TaxID=1328313 RepID=W7Q6N5_9ALTE|nr:DUF3857 and transglutaminase domain-containing protein [Catenovulum agarivorans]EWH08454.1 hypothetical protein DS2_17342 [Catenovulum agarivorans DS-2]